MVGGFAENYQYPCNISGKGICLPFGNCELLPNKTDVRFEAMSHTMLNMTSVAKARTIERDGKWALWHEFQPNLSHLPTRCVYHPKFWTIYSQDCFPIEIEEFKIQVPIIHGCACREVDVVDDWSTKASDDPVTQFSTIIHYTYIPQPVTQCQDAADRDLM